MIDDIRTAASLASSLANSLGASQTRAPATPDAGAFDAALSAARERRAQGDDPFLAPSRPGESSSRVAAANAGHRDATPPGRSDEPRGSRASAGDDERPGTDPQAQALAARQDAAAQSDRMTRNRRLAERGSEAQANAQRLAGVRANDTAQAASRAARTDEQTTTARSKTTSPDSDGPDTPANASKANDRGSAATRTDRTDRTDPRDADRTAAGDATDPTAPSLGKATSEADAPGDTVPGDPACAPTTATAPVGNESLNPAAAAATAATAATATAATAATAAAAAAAGQAETSPAAGSRGAAVQAGTPAPSQASPGTTPAADPGSDSPQSVAGRIALHQARAAGAADAAAQPGAQASPGAAESGGFRLELLGTSSGTPAGAAMATAAPRPSGSGTPGSSQGAGALQRAARDAGATAITLDWRSPGARPEPDPSAQGPGGARSQATMLLEAIQESRGATAAPNGGDAAAGAAGSFASVLNLASPAGAPASAPVPEPAQLENPWPVQDPAFVDHLAGQVSDALIGGIERAEITLNPRELGPIRIELSLSGESASIAFSATQPETRTAIEQSLPILRNMLSEHGLSLAQASVNGGAADSSGGGQPQRGANDFAPTGGASRPMAAGPAGSEPLVRSPRAARGLLDLFA